MGRYGEIWGDMSWLVDRELYLARCEERLLTPPGAVRCAGHEVRVRVEGWGEGEAEGDGDGEGEGEGEGQWRWRECSDACL